ncbi:helix-turn-helix domain-containing protein [Arundinibacter roseus]|uniref:DNA-binding protein n=1 Tax=Arundinibacter roseus TaxID=2070510 RepID=A0A4R4K9C8_9BACT|nr:helix-turn-helix domain-containing protein [Arundinibacter roseus]TDB64377.1 DNA-binding protein [Arundinibacter roseus]
MTTISISLPEEQLEKQDMLLDATQALLAEMRSQVWLTEEEAAAHFKVSKSTFRRWLVDGWIRHYKYDGVLRFNRRELDEDFSRKALVRAANEPLLRKMPLPNARKQAAQ